jgi:hypothetical protein
MMLVTDDFICEGSYLLSKLNSPDAWDNLPIDTAWLSIDDYNNSRGWNVWNDIIHKMYCQLPLEARDNIKGFEYWGNQIAGYDSLPWHQDKDEHVFANSGETVSPSVGFVYYPYQDIFTGGYLEIAVKDDFDELERIQSKFNRLIMFDPSQYHRVSRVHTGNRRAFIVNVWTDHTPQVSTNV